MSKLMNMNDPLVCIVVLNWNGSKDTIECLQSLQKITYPNYEVIVVDNASQGDDVSTIGARFGDYVHIIANDRNYGYTGGNNIGMKYALAHAAPDSCLVLNNDVVVDPDFLTHLVNAAKADASVGIVGPRVYYRDFPNRIQSAGGSINLWTGQVTLTGMKRVDVGQLNAPRDVDFLSGCCLLIRKEAIIRVGLFDESYFCYWEDVDYCIRVKRAGYRLAYVPEARVWHRSPMKERAWDTTQDGGKATRLYYYSTMNNFKFMREHATNWQYISFLIYFFGYHFWFMIGVSILYHRQPERLAGFYRGIRDGFLSKYKTRQAVEPKE